MMHIRLTAWGCLVLDVTLGGRLEEPIDLTDGRGDLDGLPFGFAVDDEWADDDDD